MSKLNGVKTVDMVNGAITKVTYDGAEYVKVPNGVAQNGDLGLALANCSDVSLGDFFEIVRIDTDGSAMFNDNGGDLRSWRTKRLSTFRKVNAKPSTPTPERLQVGDTVKVSIPDGERPAYGWGWVENGDVGKVISVNGGDVSVEFPTHSIWNGRLTELVKVANEGYVRVTDRKPKAGDYVKFSEDGYDVTAGIYYEVTAIDEEGDAEFIDDAGDENSAVVDYETFEVYEKAGVVKAETLRVGDYAKVVKLGGHDHKIGDIIKLTVSDGSKIPYEVDKDAFYKDQLVKATEEEVAEAKLAEQFAKLGRKPNEFKEGDIAKVIDSPSASPNGTLIEITAVCDAHVIGRGWCAYLGKVTTYGYGLNSHIELIAPVESRVDRQ